MARGSHDHFLVDAVAAYSNLLYPHKNARALRKLLAEAETSTRKEQSSEPTPARRLRQRLGSNVVDRIVADYRSGIPTTQLMEKYTISKTGVLNLLREAGVTMRYQPMTQDQLAKAAELYRNGNSLVAVSKQIDVPPETIRRGLIEAGVQTRGRGGSKQKD